MMLADHAQVADGKLFISGGGWSSCAPQSSPCAVAVIFHVPWHEADQTISFRLRLIDEDGRAVVQPGARDRLPVQVNGRFTARRAPAMTPGTEINVPMSFNTVLELAPGRGYSWVLDVDGHADDSWRLPFTTRPAQLGFPVLWLDGAEVQHGGEPLPASFG
jgi:hypothetical protein